MDVKDETPDVLKHKEQEKDMGEFRRKRLKTSPAAHGSVQTEASKQMC